MLPGVLGYEALATQQRKASSLGKDSEIKQLRAKVKSLKQTSSDTLLVLQAFANFLDIAPDQWRWPENMPRPLSMSKEALQHLDLLGLDLLFVLADREGGQRLWLGYLFFRCLNQIATLGETKMRHWFGALWSA